MDYKFDTQYFAVTDRSIVLMRNRFAYREVKSNEIKKIELTKGTDVKRPTISMIFGGLLIVASIYLIINFSGFRPSDLTGGRKTSRSIGYMIIMELFLFGFGGYSIYRALPIHSIIRFTMTSGEAESLTISQVIKDKKTDSLLTSLREGIGSEKITVGRELGL